MKFTKLQFAAVERRLDLKVSFAAVLLRSSGTWRVLAGGNVAEFRSAISTRAAPVNALAASNLG